jgi:hypothetical protein
LTQFFERLIEGHLVLWALALTKAA